MAAPATAAQPKRRPGWMSMPGGPKEPNSNEFRAKLQAIITQKGKIFDTLKEIQEKFGPREEGGGDGMDGERKALRQRMNEIDLERKAEHEARRTKTDEIAKVRKMRSEVEKKLKELGTELGAFRDVNDIDDAINHIMLKLETGGGSLADEKRTAKRLAKLEEAKVLLNQLAPLQEAIAEAEDREAALQQEYREIHDRIGSLNKAFEEQYTAKQSKDKEVRKVTVDRTELIKQRQECREKLTSLNDEMNKLREAFNEQQKAWNEWREEARVKFAEKVEAERKERQRRYDELRNAEKIARKKARALKRMNPHEAEIGATQTLIGYLKDRLLMSKRDEEDRKRRAALSTFDPVASAPTGFALVAPVALPKAKGGKGGKAVDATPKPVAIQHNAEKLRLFATVGVTAPMQLADIEKALEELQAKKQEFESHIKNGELELSSDEDEEQEEQEEATA